MHVLMMCVWHMAVGMGQRFVMVAMAVSANRHRVMHMGVVSILVIMGMLMVKRLMKVFMIMLLCQVQQNAAQHQ